MALSRRGSFHNAHALGFVVGRPALDFGEAPPAARQSPDAGSTMQIFSQGVRIAA